MRSLPTTPGFLVSVLLISTTLPAQATTVFGLADIWLAGQPDGSTVTGEFGSDTAPTNSPSVVAVTGGHTLTFTVTGTTSLDNGACYGPSPDGGCFADVSAFGAGPYNSLSSFAGPGDALIGVFLDDNLPSGTAPPGLDFTGAGSTAFASLSPLLNQIFFIGDGLEGTGSGATQQFIVPAGATRLFLGSSDALGANFNNVGSFTVDVSGANAAPEPGTLALLSAGLLGVCGYRFARRPRG